MAKKRIIRLTESDLYHIVSRVLNEQITNDNKILTDQQAVVQLEEDINTIIKQKQAEIFSVVKLQYVSGGYDEQGNHSDVIMKFVIYGEDASQFNLSWSNDNRRWEYRFNSVIDLGYVPISDYLTSIFENPDYKVFFGRRPNIKREIENAYANCVLYPYDRSGILITLSEVLGKNGTPWTDPIDFGQLVAGREGAGANIFYIQMNKKVQLVGQVSNSELRLKKFRISETGDIFGPKTDGGDGGNTTTTTTRNETVINISLSNGESEPFVFDTINIKPDSLKKIEKFISTVQGVKTIYGEDIYNKYVEFLKQNPIQVTAYASRDADPKAKTQGAYKPCVGYGDKTRGAYNLCLSQARADKIAKMLNESLPEIGNFIGKGMGETTQFGPGWTKEKPTTSTETLPNRRFVVVLPKFELSNIKVE